MRPEKNGIILDRPDELSSVRSVIREFVFVNQSEDNARNRAIAANQQLASAGMEQSEIPSPVPWLKTAREIQARQEIGSDILPINVQEAPFVTWLLYERAKQRKRDRELMTRPMPVRSMTGRYYARTRDTRGYDAETNRFILTANGIKQLTPIEKPSN